MTIVDPRAMAWTWTHGRAGYLLLIAIFFAGCRRSDIQVGAKLGPEQAILQQVAAQSLRAAGHPAVAHRFLDGTNPNWTALLSGDIDIYPEYTGTISQQLLKHSGRMTDEQIRAELKKSAVGMSRPVGFNDTYAIGMTSDRATALGIHSISDLAGHPELKLGFSDEFLKRTDGWAGLKPAYDLPQNDVRSMLHPVAYRAMLSGSIDATDLYSTDAEISANHLTVLTDDRRFFPEYDAVYLYRLNVENRYPGTVAILDQLAGKIDDDKIRVLNARAVVDKISESTIATQFLNPGAADETQSPWSAGVLLRFTLQHLLLVGTSMAMAILVGMPLGIIAAERPRFGQFVTAAVAGIYTIPSLALLVFMIPLLGTGKVPAIAALFLYSLLPIVRGTLTGAAGDQPGTARVGRRARPAGHDPPRENRTTAGPAVDLGRFEDRGGIEHRHRDARRSDRRRWVRRSDPDRHQLRQHVDGPQRSRSRGHDGADRARSV